MQSNANSPVFVIEHTQTLNTATCGNELPEMFFVLADVFCEHLKNKHQSISDEYILNNLQVYGICVASGIDQRNQGSLREAENYIYTSLGLGLRPISESEEVAQEQTKSVVNQDAAGHLYILRNASIPGLLKIGFTCKTVERRVAQLSSSTSIPEPFQVVASFESHSAKIHEGQVHALLAERRAPGREFFAISEESAIQACEAVTKEIL